MKSLLAKYVGSIIAIRGYRPLKESLKLIDVQDDYFSVEEHPTSTRHFPFHRVLCITEGGRDKLSIDIIQELDHVVKDHSIGRYGS